jgi:hypothetical protein
MAIEPTREHLSPLAGGADNRFVIKSLIMAAAVVGLSSR